jgi:cellulose synthase/poly-beta-1,6-N-acetylglucosamine synthase-like glycosyltransferase
MPCKGNESGLVNNIEAILNLDYPNYSVTIVTDSIADPTYEAATLILNENKRANAKICISHPHPEASGKVSALLTAMEEDHERSEVFAFVDSDSRVPPTWLSDLVDPLLDTTIGATTGFRWYFPHNGSIWSYVQSAWNASGTNLMFDNKYNFPWGGSMAISAAVSRHINLLDVWKTAVSDDLSLNMALRRNGYSILFLPQCTVASYVQETNLGQFLEWATTQTALARVYNRKLWNYALATYAFFDASFIVGLCSILLVFSSVLWAIPTALLWCPIPLGIIRSHQRCKIFQDAMPTMKRDFDSYTESNLASLIVPWIMAYCIIKSAFIDEIVWRGRRYKLNKA